MSLNGVDYAFICMYIKKKKHTNDRLFLCTFRLDDVLNILGTVQNTKYYFDNVQWILMSYSSWEIKIIDILYHTHLKSAWSFICIPSLFKRTFLWTWRFVLFTLIIQIVIVMTIRSRSIFFSSLDLSMLLLLKLVQPSELGSK